MSYSRLIVATLLIILSASIAKAQDNLTPSCQSLTGLSAVNASLLTGEWFEEYRAPAANISCVYIRVTAVNNQTQLNVTTTYSASRMGLLMDTIDSATVNISAVNANNGFNVTSNNTNTTTTFKILSVVYNSSIVLCGYTDPNDASTSFGLIATRRQMVDGALLMQLKDQATQTVPIFNSSLAGNITQSLRCKRNSATTFVPAFGTLLAAIYAILRLV